MPSDADREEIEKKALERELDEFKSKLSTWPPKRKSRVVNLTEARQPVRIQLPEPHADSYFDHTHHSISRLTFKAPPAIVDEYGLPKRRLLDCMIRYIDFLIISYFNYSKISKIDLTHIIIVTNGINKILSVKSMKICICVKYKSGLTFGVRCKVVLMTQWLQVCLLIDC